MSSSSGLDASTDFTIVISTSASTQAGAARASDRERLKFRPPTATGIRAQRRRRFFGRSPPPHPPPRLASLDAGSLQSRSAAFAAQHDVVGAPDELVVQARAARYA